MSSYRLLFVDDDASVRRPVVEYFRALGHDVYEAADGQAGIARFDEVQPQVTILDIMMPGMSGIDVLEVLKKQQAVVIMLTGFGEIETAVEAMQLGAENFLQKPIDMPHLRAAVEKAAEKARLQRENRELRARLAPSLKRMAIRGVLTAIVVAAALVIGTLIGGGSRDRATRPIPVPIEDTLP